MRRSLLVWILLICAPLAAQKIDDAGLRTPAGRIYTSEDPRLEFSYFDTYDLPPNSTEERVFAKDRLNQATTSYVYAAVEVKNLLYKERDEEYKLTFKYFIKGRRLLGEFDFDMTVKKDWEYAWYFGRWGWESPGHWPAGAHTVEVWINDTLFAVREFMIVPDKQNAS